MFYHYLEDDETLTVDKESLGGYNLNMYSYHKIISTPISNNRLNWDERGERTIVVPSLITGTLDDVITGTETVIE